MATLRNFPLTGEMRIVTVAILVGLAGCADQPEAPPAAPARIAAAAVPAKTARSPTPVDVVPTAATAAVALTDGDAATSAKARTLGLKPRVLNGKTRYCRDEATVGTRFVTTKCAAADQLDQMIREAENIKDKMRQGGSGGCMGGVVTASCGGG